MSEPGIIEFAEFLKVGMRIGTIVQARLNPKAKKSDYVLTIDFGPLGVKISSSQMIQQYSEESLPGK